MHFTLEKPVNVLETCKWAPVHLHGRELWPTGTHPHLIPTVLFPGIWSVSVIQRLQNATPTMSAANMNGISTSTSILTVSWYQHPITSLSLPHPHFPLVAPPNIMVSLLLQPMKATVLTESSQSLCFTMIFWNYADIYIHESDRRHIFLPSLTCVLSFHHAKFPF